MDPVRASELLDVIREDHELVAEHLRTLVELEAIASLADEQHLERSLMLFHEVSRFIHTKLLPHFESEEGGFFLLLREFLPRGSTLVYELESEHEQLRELCGRLCSEIELLRHQKHRRTALFQELQQICGRIAELLRQHAEREDALVQSYIKAMPQMDLHTVTS